MKDKTRTPLRIVVDVECARRGWSFTEFCRRLEAQTGKRQSKQSLATRIDAETPTRKTVTLVAGLLQIGYNNLLDRMREEIIVARANGRSVAPAMVVIPLEEDPNEN